MGSGKRVVVIDYEMCNLDSVVRAVEECGGDSVVTREPKVLDQGTHLILPGVGAFADAMANLRRLGLAAALQEQVLEKRIPVLGVCLGMQLLARRGDEGGETPGLALLPAEVRRLRSEVPGVRIPHVGWNEVHTVRPSRLLEGIQPGKDFYFVHSYHVVCDDPADSVATTPYADGFTSVVEHENVFGVQFHPEKSQQAGFRLLRNFLAV